MRQDSLQGVGAAQIIFDDQQAAFTWRGREALLLRVRLQ
jgi:hypothetical protein